MNTGCPENSVLTVINYSCQDDDRLMLFSNNLIPIPVSWLSAYPTLEHCLFLKVIILILSFYRDYQFNANMRNFLLACESTFQKIKGGGGSLYLSIYFFHLSLYIYTYISINLSILSVQSLQLAGHLAEVRIYKRIQ